ncbi:hypothetical protein MW376_000562 [Citrobacter freundii]|nr:hypothetical protein [Citrobacter freundii]EJB8470526.1 hypothetical protein [Citrobacter freundii]EJB8560907.1 hypothetical protein [Citrobacter freundii]QLO04339.1 hypothetical protein HV141_12765 [Citrobacter freundii]QLU67073.1 hypothetical protein HV173_13170 [Citrobacter freundii]
MYNNNEVISYLQANKILALKLDYAVSAVGQKVTNQVETLGKGATRLLYYTSCFTDEYNDVYQQQKTEDLRFRNGVIRIIQHGDVVYEMLCIYFEEIFKYKTNDQLEHIKKVLMAVNVHIAASTLTGAGYALAVATSVRIGLNLSMQFSALAGRAAGTAAGVVATYGLVQKAADSAHRLHVQYPAYYSALYMQQLEMMYFLIESVFERAGALEAQWSSDSSIANIITRMIR